MNTISKSLILKAMGFIAATCIAQLLVLDTAFGLVQTAEAAESAAPATMLAATSDAIARPPVGTARRCDALDSFGNPVRPCRA